MNHADIDPSLCTAEPVLEKLDDGFSPPAADERASPQPQPQPAPAPPVLGTKSLF